MKKMIALLLGLMLLCSAALAEQPLLINAEVTNGVRTMTFRYPDGCTVTEDGAHGTFVHLNDEAYAVVVLLEEGKSITGSFEETKAPEMEILRLSETMELLVCRDKTGHGVPGWPALDIVEVGVTLADGRCVIVQSTCPSGDTEIYPVLVTILGSITDTQPLQRWLDAAWLPLVKGETADVLKYYLTACGKWYDYPPALWLEFAAAVRTADSDDSQAVRAIAAADYILPPEGSLSYEQAAEIAVQAAGGGQVYPNMPCFLLNGRAVYKAALHEGASFSAAVELDAVTGEVLGVYPADEVHAAAYFVPHDVWAAAQTGYPSLLALTDDYTARYGNWWTWEPAVFRQYSLELRRVQQPLTSRTALAMADTNYILPPEDALSPEQAASLALAAAGAPELTYVNTLYFLVVTDGDDRPVCKVILTDGTHYSHAVELDAFTGEVLRVQGFVPLEGAGAFLTPGIVWENTARPQPANG